MECVKITTLWPSWVAPSPTYQGQSLSPTRSYLSPRQMIHIYRRSPCILYSDITRIDPPCRPLSIEEQYWKAKKRRLFIFEHRWSLADDCQLSCVYHQRLKLASPGSDIAEMKIGHRQQLSSVVHCGSFWNSSRGKVVEMQRAILQTYTYILKKYIIFHLESLHCPRGWICFEFNPAGICVNGAEQ